MGTTYSNFFSAIAPVAGGGLIWRAKRLKTTPVYAYHGDADTVIPISESERMVAKVIGAGGSASLATLYDLGHNEGIDYAYRNTDLIEKLICARRTDFTRIPESYEEFFY